MSDMEHRSAKARPDDEDSSTVLADHIIAGRMSAVGTVSAVGPDDEWFDPDKTKQDMAGLERDGDVQD